jgi:hypothetical protein
MCQPGLVRIDATTSAGDVVLGLVTTNSDAGAAVNAGSPGPMRWQSSGKVWTTALLW